MGRNMFGRKMMCCTKVYCKKISSADGSRLKLKILKPMDLESSHTVASSISGHIVSEESTSSNFLLAIPLSAKVSHFMQKH